MIAVYIIIVISVMVAIAVRRDSKSQGFDDTTAFAAGLLGGCAFCLVGVIALALIQALGD